MTIAELNFTPRLKGRASKPLQVSLVRELTSADLALLASERETKAPALKTLRDRHHSLARCLALGMPDYEAAAVTGYTPSRISVLKADPTFGELVTHYLQQSQSEVASYHDRAVQVAITALDVIAERLEDDPDKVTTTQALQIAKDLGDRTGHSPVQKVQQTNVNVDLSARMASARNRVNAANQALTIEGTSRPVGET